MSKRERIEALEARVAALEASNAAGSRDDEACEAVHASGLACTLDLDHDGHHVATGGPAMVLQTWTDPEPVEVPCDADWAGDVGGYYGCDLPKGHDGPHDNNDGVTWDDPEPDAEVIDAQILCGVSRIIDGVMRSCDKGAGHDGEHVSASMARRWWTDPEPVPQWRAMVETGEAAIWWGDGTISAGHALSRVLHDTATLASGEGGWQIRTLALARIVAVAEGQVGDGWKADPDNWDRDWDDHVDIWIMLDALSVTEQRWQTVGDRAAAWLRDITTDGAS